MPIYEFECEACGNQFEKITTFSNTTAPNCPACESDHVVRQMSKPSIHFKGSGWYITDSKKASKKSANGTESSSNGADKAAGNGDASQAESKPAAAGEASTTTSSESKSSTKASSSESK
ncbi:MAG: zinc ribbon domain-containing protein [Caldilineaceae bacterium]|nr:zinc ribbon domain-containing protein [Caldilineaceae bacterium]